MNLTSLRTLATLGVAGIIVGGAAIAPAAAAPAPTEPTAPAAAAPSHNRFPSEWSSPNGDWAIASTFDGHDTSLRMGTFSHRDTIRVFITDPTGKRSSHDFQLEQSAVDDSWYQFSDSWRKNYPDAGPGQYKVVFAMKTSKGWRNICDKTLGFIVR